MTDATAALMAMTTGIVVNYVTHNRLAPDELPALIQSIHGALSTIDDPKPGPVVEDIAKPTAAQIRRSISDSGLVSFLDGKTYQSLKRHLTRQGVSPAAYREGFGLNEAYPMVAPSYSARRSEIAKSLGLGEQRDAETRAPGPKGPQGSDTESILTKFAGRTGRCGRFSKRLRQSSKTPSPAGSRGPAETTLHIAMAALSRADGALSGVSATRSSRQRRRSRP